MVLLASAALIAAALPAAALCTSDPCTPSPSPSPSPSYDVRQVNAQDGAPLLVTFQTQNGLLTLMFGQNQQPTLGGLTGFAPEQQASFPPDIARAYAFVLKAPPPSPFDQRWSAWGSAFGGIGRINGDPASGGVTAHAYVRSAADAAVPHAEV
jgi:hypothetical protein